MSDSDHWLTRGLVLGKASKHELQDVGLHTIVWEGALLHSSAECVQLGNVRR